MSFQVIFLLALALFFLVMLAEGWRSWRRGTGEADYLVAGRRMGPLVGGASISATQMSAGTFVGTLGIHYQTGSSFLTGVFGIWTAFFVTGFFVAPRLRRYAARRGAVTFPDYLADRFGGRAPRALISFLLIISYVVFMSAQYQAGGIILSLVFPISFVWGSVILMIVIVLYTIIGGMSAVMRTNFVQQLIMAIGVVIGAPLAIAQAGGWDSLTASLSAVTPHDLTGWEYDWVDLLGFGLGFGFGALCAPVLLMRFYTMRDDQTCRRGSIVAILFTMLTLGMVAVIGMCMRVIKPNLSMPDNASTVFAIDVLPPFVGALVLTAVVAAVLSTVDSVLLVVGPAVSHDLYAQLIHPAASERTRMRVNRIATAILGVLPIVLTFAQLDVVQFIVLAYAALVASVVFAPLILGLYWRRANAQAAVTAMIAGFSVCLLWYAIGQPFIAPVIPGVAAALIAMIIVSLATPRPNNTLLDPFFNRSS